ncbi:MAG TPA: hypothetical protein VE261_06600, partial [Gaiellaceae bacterium]|nr:hypothetical protein [Gaiellaceae bacterium]
RPTVGLSIAQRQVGLLLVAANCSPAAAETQGFDRTGGGDAIGSRASGRNLKVGLDGGDEAPTGISRSQLSDRTFRLRVAAEALCRPRSKQDDCVTPRRAPATERRERGPCIDWEQLAQTRGGNGKHGPVMASVAEQQHDNGRGAVALLEAHAPLEGLYVMHVRLGFDPYGDGRAVDRGVPCPVVERARHGQLDDRHLDAPPQRRVQTAAEPFQQCEMRSIADWRPVGKAFRSQLQTSDREELRQTEHRHTLPATLANARDRGRRNPDRATDLGVAEAGVEAGRFELAAELGDDAPTVRGAAVDCSNPGWHGRGS